MAVHCRRPVTHTHMKPHPLPGTARARRFLPFVTIHTSRRARFQARIAHIAFPAQRYAASTGKGT